MTSLPAPFSSPAPSLRDLRSSATSTAFAALAGGACRDGTAPAGVKLFVRAAILNRFDAVRQGCQSAAGWILVVDGRQTSERVDGVDDEGVRLSRRLHHHGPELSKYKASISVSGGMPRASWQRGATILALTCFPSMLTRSGSFGHSASAYVSCMQEDHAELKCVPMPTRLQYLRYDSLLNATSLSRRPNSA